MAKGVILKKKFVPTIMQRTQLTQQTTTVNLLYEFAFKFEVSVLKPALDNIPNIKGIYVKITPGNNPKLIFKPISDPEVPEFILTQEVLQVHSSNTPTILSGNALQEYNSVNAGINFLPKSSTETIDLVAFSIIDMNFLLNNNAISVYFSRAIINVGYYSQIPEAILASPGLQPGQFFTLKCEAHLDSSIISVGSNSSAEPTLVLGTPCPPLWKPDLYNYGPQI